MPDLLREAVRTGSGDALPGVDRCSLRPLGHIGSQPTIALTNTRNTPVEAFERVYPMRVLRYRLRRGSGGAGLAAGGDGIERDLLVLEPCTVSLITERRVSQPWGLAGGGDGAVGENWLLRGGSESAAERLADKCTVRLQAGDVLRVLTPGGGGWGAPPRAADRRTGADRRDTIDLTRFERGEPERRQGRPGEDQRRRG